MRALVALVVACGCQGQAPEGGPGGSGGDDGLTPDAGDPQVTAPCATPLAIPTTGRALDLMPPARLAEVASRAPCVPAGPVRTLLESAETLWYDKHSLTPGYQDSFGDNVVAPIGMRPNTIDPGLIDTAVPGGHAQIFSSIGVFEFPFGHPLGPTDDVAVVDFWWPAQANGAALPVVYWKRDPNQYTHRYEWMFPIGTVFGEMLFIDEGGERHPFEIRTRTRTATGWAVDVLRPFPRATDLADAIEEAGGTSPALTALVTQLRGTAPLAAHSLGGTHFPGAFPTRTGGIEMLPALTGADSALVRGLLRTTPFRSARGIAWKQAGGKTAWAAGAAGRGTIVPTGYSAASVEVSEPSCDGCHRDAGRPFKDWYDNILAYGELWGNDEIFTWHPFTLSKFVDAQGEVVNFNYDNREIRPDLRAAGLVAPYVPTTHPASQYKRLVRDWTDFAY
ncbi:MAG: hypothetical protein JNL83_13585 [Myxococcales bacterium]|nr:hypothetical protein [Myxococcales bacterium]